MKHPLPCFCSIYLVPLFCLDYFSFQVNGYLCSPCVTTLGALQSTLRINPFKFTIINCWQATPYLTLCYNDECVIAL